MLKLYKQTLKEKKQNHIQKTLIEIEDSIHQNQFWEKLNNLSNKTNHELAIQNHEIWKNTLKTYLKNLLQTISNLNRNKSKKNYKYWNQQ